MIQIIELEEEIPVYDITVEDNHNFYANDILVHNCTEIMLPTSADKETFNCFLASVNLSNIYDDSAYDKINWNKLAHVSKVLTKRLDYAQGEYVGNLVVNWFNNELSFKPFDKLAVIHRGINKEIFALEFEEGMRLRYQGLVSLCEIIDKPKFLENNFYPTKETLMGAMKGRPNGLGMMGWQDLLFKLRIPFDSDEATNLLDRITEVISYSAYEASVELAIEKGPAPIFKGSLPSQGIMPLDSMKMLGEDRGLDINVNLGYNLDWSVLKANIKKHGLRNLWVMAPAPTATISTVVGSYPTIEAQYSNLYVKENMSGTFVVLNKYLVNDLEKLGLWNEEMKNKIKDNQGKLLGIEGIPDDIVELYKDAFEIDQEKYIEQGAVMSKWIDQSHSRNIFVDVASGKVLNNIYMSAWESGLKSTYYLRSKGASNNNS